MLVARIAHVLRILPPRVAGLVITLQKSRTNMHNDGFIGRPIQSHSLTYLCINT